MCVYICLFIVLRIHTLINVLMYNDVFSVYQYKNHPSGRISHTGPFNMMSILPQSCMTVTAVVRPVVHNCSPPSRPLWGSEGLKSSSARLDGEKEKEKEKVEERREARTAAADRRVWGSIKSVRAAASDWRPSLSP